MEDRITQEINIYHLLRFYVTKWAWIISASLIGVIAGFIYSNYIQTPLYKSDATLLVIAPSDGAAVQNTTLINNYIELFESRRVLEPVIDEQKLGMSYENLLGSVAATNSKSTQVIKVSITTEDAHTSQRALEGAVKSFKQQVAKLYSSDNVHVVDDANLPSASYNIRENITLAVAGTASAVLSIVILFFVYDFNLSRGKYTTSNSVVVTKTQTKVKKIKEDKSKKVPAAEEGQRSKTFRENMRSVLFGDTSKFEPLNKKEVERKPKV